jgi:hypothetical protein
MTDLLTKLLLLFRGGTSRLLALGGLLLLTWGLVSPVGTLVWWLNQGSELGLKRHSLLKDRLKPSEKAAKINCYIVFLTGVGDYSVDQSTPGEEYFLDRLLQLHPNCVEVLDVFPYSAANEDLAGNRFLSPLWRAAQQGEGWLKQADILIKIRNLWRFAISADDRYGEIYNPGIADAIVDRMNAAYPISAANATAAQPIRVVLVGTSGGVQVALGAVPSLRNWLDAQLIVVSAGGAFDGEAGFDDLDLMYHLRGERDWVEMVPHVLFPSRWAWAINSPINRARREGRYFIKDSGPQAHDGDEGYFGQAIAPSTRKEYVEITLEQVNQLPFWSTLPSRK